LGKIKKGLTNKTIYVIIKKKEREDKK